MAGPTAAAQARRRGLPRAARPGPPITGYPLLSSSNTSRSIRLVTVASATCSPEGSAGSKQGPGPACSTPQASAVPGPYPPAMPSWAAAPGAGAKSMPAHPPQAPAARTGHQSQRRPSSCCAPRAAGRRRSQVKYATSRAQTWGSAAECCIPAACGQALLRMVLPAGTGFPAARTQGCPLGRRKTGAWHPSPPLHPPPALWVLTC